MEAKDDIAHNLASQSDGASTKGACSWTNGAWVKGIRCNGTHWSWKKKKKSLLSLLTWLRVCVIDSTFFNLLPQRVISRGSRLGQQIVILENLKKSMYSAKEMAQWLCVDFVECLSSILRGKLYIQCHASSRRSDTIFCPLSTQGMQIMQYIFASKQNINMSKY